MSGIAGKIARKQKVDRRLLERMAEVMKHRGPDDTGIYVDNEKAPFAGLSHARLSVIDIATGRQPMSNEDGSLRLVHDGEIYNFLTLKEGLLNRGHIFKTEGDAEVLLHLYEEKKEAMLEDLRGMFSFAIWDNARKRLFAARDRVGQKPFVYFYDGNSFIFASELKAILEDKSAAKDIDFTAVADFFTYGYVPSPKAIFRNMFKLPPAHMLLLDENGVRIKKYWQPNYNDKIYFKSDAGYEEKIGELLDEAVKLRLVSDVPVGVLLSGGIDSSSILSFMARNMRSPVKSFSVGFEEESYNELKHASSMARLYKTTHKELIVRENAIKILAKLAWHYNEPFGDSSSVPTYLASRMTREFVKVALCGDGGDEAFGGYARYAMFRFLAKKGPMDRMLSRSSLGLLGLAKPFLYGSRFHNYATRFLESRLFSENPAERYLHVMGMFPGLDIFTEKFFENIKGYRNRAYFNDKYRDLDMRDARESCMKLDFFTSLPEDLMVKADIAAMANSLEVRSPFLDHKLLEFALRIPFDKKIKFLRTKVILKKYLKRKGFVTDEILRRKKQGFAVPAGEWFKRDLGQYLKGLLSESVFVKNGFFDRGRIDSLIEEHVSGKRDHAHRLWSILNFELWHKIFMEGVSPGSLVKG